MNKRIYDIDWLKDEYLVKNRSLKEISQELGISVVSIRKVIKKNGFYKDKEKIKLERISNMKKTNLIKYGVETPFQSKEIQNKVESSFKEKYGVSRPFLLTDFQEKAKIKIKEKYGVEWAMKNPLVVEKNRNSVFQKYGVYNVFENELIKNKIKQTFQEKYQINNPSENSLFIKKREDTMLSKYGVSNAGENPEFIKKGLLTKKHLGQLYELEGKTLSEISEENKIDLSSLRYYYLNYNPLTIESLVKIVKASGNKITWIEQKFSNFFKIEKWNKKIDKNISYRPDFKFNNKFYVNVDGLFWHSEGAKEAGKFYYDKYYHSKLREKFEDLGISIFQFREDEIKDKFNIISSIVNNKLQISQKVFARKCQIKKVSLNDAIYFLKNNHLMGSINGVTHTGLFYNEELICLLSYKIKKNELIIERFCSKCNFTVIGGLSKLLKFIIVNKKINKILSWVDLRYGTGNSLESIGFQKVKDVLSWRWTDGIKTYHRLKCRANMDERKLSEKEYAFELGWYRIYDAGQRLFIKNI